MTLLVTAWIVQLTIARSAMGDVTSSYVSAANVRDYDAMRERICTSERAGASDAALSAAIGKIETLRFKSSDNSGTGPRMSLSFMRTGLVLAQLEIDGKPENRRFRVERHGWKWCISPGAPGHYLGVRS